MAETAEVRATDDNADVRATDDDTPSFLRSESEGDPAPSGGAPGVSVSPGVAGISNDATASGDREENASESDIDSSDSDMGGARAAVARPAVARPKRKQVRGG